MTTAWRVRPEGSPTPVDVPTAQGVVDGLRDGDWEPADEVRGPADRGWTAIEDHPQFAEAVAELEQPTAEKPDETRLDMNPLIDVALVLLIFFILTTSYASLRRAIDLPPEPADKGKAAVVKQKDIQDRTFKVKVRMDGDRPVVKIEDKVADLDKLDQEFQDYVKKTRRTEMQIDVSQDVPWGVEAKVYDAAKGAEIHQIWWKGN